MSNEHSALKALAVAISAFPLIALFWAIILVLAITHASNQLIARGGEISAAASDLKITDITGGITALCALFVAGFSLWTVRRHNILSARPRISIVRVIKNNDGKKEGLYLRNHGLGPALIDELIIEIDAKKTVISRYQDLKRLFELYDFECEDLGVYWMDLLPKDACERFIWLESEKEDKKEEFKRLMFDTRLEIQVRHGVDFFSEYYAHPNK